MKIINFLKSWVNPPSPQALASKELESAQRALLAAQSEEEFATAMVDYNQKRIERLSKYIAESQKNEKLDEVSTDAGWSGQMTAIQAETIGPYTAPAASAYLEHVKPRTKVNRGRVRNAG